MNFNMPDNKYLIRMNNQRAGSNKSDLCALGGMIMSWQVGHDRFQILMRRKENRLRNAIEFSKD